VFELQQELTAAAHTVDQGASRALADLATAMASMRAALESGVTIRLEHPHDAELVGAAEQSILAQRGRLQQAIFAFDAATA
jgi:hypothetical protein